MQGKAWSSAAVLRSTDLQLDHRCLAGNNLVDRIIDRSAEHQVPLTAGFGNVFSIGRILVLIWKGLSVRKS